MIPLEDLVRRNVDVVAMMNEIDLHYDAASSRCKAAESTYLPGLEALITAGEARARLLGVDHSKAAIKMGVSGAWIVVNGALIAIALPAGVAVAALTGMALVLSEARSRLDQNKVRSIAELRAIAVRLRGWIAEVRDLAGKLTIMTLAGNVRYTSADGKKIIKRIEAMSDAERRDFSVTFKSRLTSLVTVDKKLMADLRAADQAIN
jgi:hypothetical protein